MSSYSDKKFLSWKTRIFIRFSQVLEVIRFAHNFLLTRGEELSGEFDKIKNLWYNFKKKTIAGSGLASVMAVIERKDFSIYFI